MDCEVPTGDYPDGTPSPSHQPVDIEYAEEWRGSDDRSPSPTDRDVRRCANQNSPPEFVDTEMIYQDEGSWHGQPAPHPQSDVVSYPTGSLLSIPLSVVEVAEEQHESLAFERDASEGRVIGRCAR